VKFASPIGNPDEPKLCKKHFNKMVFALKLNEKFVKWHKATLVDLLNFINRNHPHFFKKVLGEFNEWRRGN